MGEMKEATQEKETQYIVWRIHILQNLIKQRGEQMVNYWPELSAMQAYVLSFLVTKHPEMKIYQKDIEHIFRLRKSSLSTLLGQLEQKGLIAKELSSQDNRSRRIIPTEEALRYREKMLQEMADFESGLIEDIDREDLEAFVRVTEKLYQRLAPEAENLPMMEAVRAHMRCKQRAAGLEKRS